MININNLSFGYSNKLLFDDLSLNLELGKIYGLIGKNGAGKTSLLKVISGLIKPKKGISRIGDEISFERDPEVMQKLFFISESFSLPNIKVKDYMNLLALFYSKFSKEDFYTRIKDLEVDPESYLPRLSYGQKKKSMLACALASNAKVLIFDEPTNGLDIPSQRVFKKMIAESLTEDRVFIISTHHIKELENLFDELIVLESGKVMFKSEVNKIIEGLTVKLVQDIEEYQDRVIYSEKVPGGFSVIVKDEKGAENQMLLEMLISAVLSGDENTIKYMKNKMEV